MIWIVVAVLGAAAAAGVVASRLLRRPSAAPPAPPGAHPGRLPVSELVIPVVTFTVILLAFVLLQTFESFADAEERATEEGAAVRIAAQAAVQLDQPGARRVLGTLRCYARSVAGPEWRSLENRRGPAPETDLAQTRVAAAERAAARGQAGPLIAAVQAADRDRIATRRLRLAEAEPTLPDVIVGLLIFCVALVVGGFAALADPRIRRSVRAAVLGSTALVLGLTLVTIADVDRPFDGLAAVEPDALRTAERYIARLPSAGPRRATAMVAPAAPQAPEVRERRQGATLPADRPIVAAVRRPATPPHTGLAQDGVRERR